jgi:outer membrane receptor protein involved in Fe transport
MGENGGMLRPRLDVYGQSEICTSLILVTAEFPFAGCSDGYEIVNARLEWTAPGAGWRVAVGATNVTDEEYFLNKFDLTAFGQPHAEGQPGPPQAWYLALQRDF